MNNINSISGDIWKKNHEDHTAYTNAIAMQQTAREKSPRKIGDLEEEDKVKAPYSAVV